LLKTAYTNKRRCVAIYRKKVDEIVEIPIVETKIWSCSEGNCNGWMRDEFTLESTPTCPFCQSEMKEDIKLLPEMNVNYFYRN
jgi:hypothetical protein